MMTDTDGCHRNAVTPKRQKAALHSHSLCIPTFCRYIVALHGGVVVFSKHGRWEGGFGLVPFHFHPPLPSLAQLEAESAVNAPARPRAPVMYKFTTCHGHFYS